MATVEELAREIIGSVDSNIGYLLATQWIDRRYKELVARVRFRHLRQVGELRIPAPYDTGTVTCTRDATSVTGSGTTWTNIGTGTQEYYYFRAKTAWYKIASIGADTSLTLTTKFSEDTVSGSDYKIVRRHNPLDTSARWISTFWHDRRRRKLYGPYPQDVLNSKAPERTLVGTDPLFVCQVGTDTNGTIIVEIYPYPKESEIFHYVYWSLPSTLAITDTIPPQIDGYVLKEGVLVDAYRYKMAEAADKGDATTAQFWRNEMHAQRTVWNNVINDAIRADQGADDVTLILDTMGGPYVSSDIRTARDHWLVEGDRP